MMPTKAEKEAQAAADALLAESTGSVVDDSDSTSVSVDLEDGPVVLTRGGVEVASFSVKGGKINVKDDAERALLTSSLPGAKLD